MGVKAVGRLPDPAAKGRGRSRPTSAGSRPDVARAAGGVGGGSLPALRLIACVGVRPHVLSASAVRDVLFAESVALSLHLLGFLIPSLLPVQLQRLPPHREGLADMAQGGVGMTEPDEGVGGFSGVVAVAVAVAVEADGLAVVPDGVMVTAAVVVDVAEAVQGLRPTVYVLLVLEEGEGGLAVPTGGVVLTHARGAPAHGVARVGFRDGLIEALAEVQCASGMVRHPPAVRPDRCRRVVRLCLLGGIILPLAQRERLVQGFDRLPVVPANDLGAAQDPVGEDLGARIGQSARGVDRKPPHGEPIVAVPRR